MGRHPTFEVQIEDSNVSNAVETLIEQDTTGLFRASDEGDMNVDGDLIRLTFEAPVVSAFDLKLFVNELTSIDVVEGVAVE